MNGVTKIRPKVQHGTRSVGAIDRYVGAKIMAARRARGWSRGDMETMVGLSQPQIHKIETAETKCSIQNLYSFAKVLRVPFEWFIQGFTNSAAATEDLPVLDLGENEVKLAQKIGRLPERNRQLILKMVNELATAQDNAQSLESDAGETEAA